MKCAGEEGKSLRVDRRPKKEIQRQIASFLKGLYRKQTRRRTNSPAVALCEGGKVAAGLWSPLWDHRCMPSNCRTVEVNPNAKICKRNMLFFFFFIMLLVGSFLEPHNTENVSFSISKSITQPIKLKIKHGFFLHLSGH